MDLLTYVTDLGRRRLLSAELGCSSAYLWQLAKRWRGRKPSEEFAIEIERATRRLGSDVVSVASLRPDVEWQLDGEGVVIGYLVRLPSPLSPIPTGAGTSSSTEPCAVRVGKAGIA